MQYCKQYINQCRDRLLSEFDVWYAKSFLGLQQGPVSTDGEIPKSKQVGTSDVLWNAGVYMYACGVMMYVFLTGCCRERSGKV